MTVPRRALAVMITVSGSCGMLSFFPATKRILHTADSARVRKGYSDKWASVESHSTDLDTVGVCDRVRIRSIAVDTRYTSVPYDRATRRAHY